MPAHGSTPQTKLQVRAVRCVAVLGLLWLVGPPSGALGASAGQKCATAKVKAFGAAVLARAECQAQARLAGGEPEPACLLKVKKKLTKRIAKADAKSPCPGDAPGTLGTATACVVAFDGALTGTSACVARKIRAAGQKAAGEIVCVIKATLAGTAIDPACLRKVDNKFTGAIAKADKRGTCTAVDLDKLVDACVDGLPPPIPCTGGTGHPTCDGTCPEGLACRPYEVFTNGASAQTGCGCVNVATGPECTGTTCGTDRHCADPTQVCERWMTGDPLGCDHMICQPAITTPTTLPDGEGIPCDTQDFPTCGGTCSEGRRCQSIQAFYEGATYFSGCVCVDPRDPRCEMTTTCNVLVLPYSHCADPSKTCLVQLALGDEKNPGCSEAHCGDPLPVIMPTTTTIEVTSTSTSSSTTSSSTSSSTTTSLPCTSTPGTSGCFTDLGDCTILDTCTGLQWEKKQMAPASPHDVEKRYVWGGCCGDGCNTMCQPNAAAKATCLATAQASTDGCTDQCPVDGGCYVERGGLAVTTIFDWVNQLNAENFAGHNDWRVPTEAGLNATGTKELSSILEHPCVHVPCIDPIFGPTMTTSYWSRTGDESRTVDGWFVNFFDGTYGNLIKREALFVRAVR